MNETIRAFKDKLFAAAKAKGFSDCELFMNGSDSFSVRIFKGEIQEYKNAGSSGMSFRGTYNGKVGYAYSEKVGDDVVDFLVENAMQNAQVIEDPDTEELYPGDAEYPEVKTYDPALDQISVQEKINKALALEKAAFEADKRVIGVDNCSVSSGAGYMYIANTKGLDLTKRSNYAAGFVMARVSENGQTKIDGERKISMTGADWESFSPECVAKEGVEKATAKLGAKSVPSGAYDVILDKDTAGSLLRVFTGSFDAERVQKGLSLFKGKLESQVAAENVTIRDDALLDYKPGSQPFDDEGVACGNKAIIENGILKTFLHNTKTAKKDGVKPTGNASKASYKSALGISPNNLYIVPSETSKDELIKEMNNGLIITGLAGLHSGANGVSGDFSLGADGFLVENGEIVRAVEQITIAGNFFQVLNNIVKAASDLEFGMGSVTSPSLWIKGINVSGS